MGAEDDANCDIIAEGRETDEEEEANEKDVSAEGEEEGDAESVEGIEGALFVGR